jgi:hypothetical protein
MKGKTLFSVGPMRLSKYSSLTMQVHATKVNYCSDAPDISPISPCNITRKSSIS